MSENLSGALKSPPELNAAVEGNDVYLLTLNRCLQLETISLYQPGRKQTKMFIKNMYIQKTYHIYISLLTRTLRKVHKVNKTKAEAEPRYHLPIFVLFIE